MPVLGHAKKRKKKKKKAKFSAFGCVNVGGFCKNNSQCCSNICAGKKGKKKCKAHDQSTCVAGQQENTCNATKQNVFCTTTAGAEGFCDTTTGNAAYCLFDGDCFPCSKDTDCIPFCGAQAACVVCEDFCPQTGGTACAGVSEDSCTFPEP